MRLANPSRLDFDPNQPVALRAAHSAADDLQTSTAIDRSDFIDAMSGAATGVNIVTTDGPSGRFGLTVSAFASVSADPPTVLICINEHSPVCAAIERNGRFCVNVLAHGQDALAQSFAGRPRAGGPYDFGRGDWQTGKSGTPVLIDAVASFECTLAQIVAAGSHRVFLGRCAAVKQRPAPPLIYANRSYGQICRSH